MIDLVARMRAAGCVFAEEEAELLTSSAGSPDDLERMAGLRISGLPLEQVLGWAEFCGQRIAVEAGVFVPRVRSELLVREAAALVRSGDLVVELCCGSGAISVALLALCPDIELVAADVDPVAVGCARTNIGAAGRVFQGDLCSALPVELHGRIAVLVANAPYVPTSAIALLPPEARDHEPLVSLDGGADGLDVQRRVLAEASSWLATGGSVLVETSELQAAQSLAIAERAGLAGRIVRADALDATVVIGRRLHL